MLAACSRAYRSRTIARAITMPAAAPPDWTMRPKISTPMVGAAAHSTLPAMNITRPAITTGRRPNRSDKGP